MVSDSACLAAGAQAPPGKAHLQSAPAPPGSPASPEDYERMVQEVCMFILLIFSVTAPAPPSSPASPEDYERMVQEVCMFILFCRYPCSAQLACVARGL